MTVKELIDILQEYDMDAQVIVESLDDSSENDIVDLFDDIFDDEVRMVIENR